VVQGMGFLLSLTMHATVGLEYMYNIVYVHKLIWCSTSIG